MVRGLIVGGTDYSHQSFSEMMIDLQNWIRALNEDSVKLEQIIKSLEEQKYWSKVNYDFRGLIHETLRFFGTAIEEISEISSELQETVRKDHIQRLRSLTATAKRMNQQFGEVWNQEPEWTDYNHPSFKLVEDLYQIGRDMVADLIDVGNLASRLADFEGKRSVERFSLANLFSNPWAIGIGTTVIAGVILAILLPSRSSHNVNNQSINTYSQTNIGTNINANSINLHTTESSSRKREINPELLGNSDLKEFPGFKATIINDGTVQSGNFAKQLEIGLRMAGWIVGGDNIKMGDPNFFPDALVLEVNSKPNSSNDDSIRAAHMLQQELLREGTKCSIVFSELRFPPNFIRIKVSNQ
jgi:hypothetical protein